MSEAHNKLIQTQLANAVKDPIPAWNHSSDVRPPKFFFNFIGPESDEVDYKPSCPETDLSLGQAYAASDEESSGSGGGAARESNLLEVMERVSAAYDGRRFLWPTRGPDPLSALRRRFERDHQTRLLMPAPSNYRRTDVAQPAALSAAPHSRVLPLLGPESSQRREIVLAGAGAGAGPSRRARDEASPSTALPHGKKLKSAAEGVETVIIPQRMPDPTVIMKGFVKKQGPNEPTTIVCLCHDKAHSPESFIKHAAGVGGVGEGSKSTCYVTVSRGIPGDGLDYGEP